jgi:aminomethyltransferase
MPLQYAGIVAEHLHTRSAASLFDVSHMGQLLLTGRGADRALEQLLPGDIVGLAEGRMRYSLLTLSHGGILDDLMVVRLPSQEAGESGAVSRLHLIINAARRQVDEAHLPGASAPRCAAGGSEQSGAAGVAGPDGGGCTGTPVA